MYMFLNRSLKKLKKKCICNDRDSNKDYKILSARQLVVIHRRGMKFIHWRMISSKPIHHIYFICLRAVSLVSCKLICSLSPGLDCVHGIWMHKKI